MTLLDELKKKYPGPDRWAMRTALFEASSGISNYVRDKTLIRTSLIQFGYADLARKISSCKFDRKCKSPYCDACQKDLIRKQQKRSDKFLLYPYRKNEAKGRENLFFVTILHALVPFDVPDCDLIRFPTKEIKKILAEARKNFKAVRRSFKDEINFVGAFELEAVTGLLANLHPVKGQVLAEMNRMTLGLDHKFILVHSHFVVDMAELPIDQLTADPAIEQLKVRLRKIWSAKKQVEVSPLYEKKAVKESLIQLAKYPLKFPVKYYYRFNDMSEQNNVVVEGKTHNLARNYQPDVLAELVVGVSEIGSKALIIRQGISRADQAKPRTDAKLRKLRSLFDFG